jgi:hypothetical protein
MQTGDEHSKQLERCSLQTENYHAILSLIGIGAPPFILLLNFIRPPFILIEQMTTVLAPRRA